MAEPGGGDSRLTAAAGLLRAATADGVAPDRELVAALLEELAPLAVYWREPYAAPFVPVIQAAVRVAGQVLDEAEGPRRGEVTGGEG